MYFVLYFGLSSFLLFNFVYFHVTFLLFGYIVFVVACMFYFMLFILFDRPQDWCLSYDRSGWICSSKGCIVLQSPVLNKMRLLSTVWFLCVTLSIYLFFSCYYTRMQRHSRMSDSWQLLHQLFLTLFAIIVSLKSWSCLRTDPDQEQILTVNAKTKQ